MLIKCYLKRVLVILDYARLMRFIGSKRFEKVGHRRYRLRL